MSAFIIDVIVDGALDETIHTSDLESELARLRGECSSLSVPVELHYRPEHVEHAGEFTDDGSGVVRIEPQESRGRIGTPDDLILGSDHTSSMGERCRWNDA